MAFYFESQKRGTITNTMASFNTALCSSPQSYRKSKTVSPAEADDASSCFTDASTVCASNVRFPKYPGTLSSLRGSQLFSLDCCFCCSPSSLSYLLAFSTLPKMSSTRKLFISSNQNCIDQESHNITPLEFSEDLAAFKRVSNHELFPRYAVAELMTTLARLSHNRRASKNAQLRAIMEEVDTFATKKRAHLEAEPIYWADLGVVRRFTSEQMEGVCANLLGRIIARRTNSTVVTQDDDQEPFEREFETLYYDDDSRVTEETDPREVAPVAAVAHGSLTNRGEGDSYSALTGGGSYDEASGAGGDRKQGEGDPAAAASNGDAEAEALEAGAHDDEAAQNNDD